MEKINFVCLHGFLGRPSDWDMVESYFMVSSLAHRFEWWSVDYMKNPVLNPQQDFAAWAENFDQKLALRYPKGPIVLVGYSLGGRLALHALKQNSSRYAAVILLSANPGLTREKDRFERRQNDRLWAKKFQEHAWADLLQEWNSQSVFKDSVQEPQRLESDYSRPVLAEALTTWSVANQQDLRPVVIENGSKILWLAGEKDIKYLSLSMEMKKISPKVRTEMVPKASHRVLFDNPSGCAALMIRFLEDKLKDYLG